MTRDCYDCLLKGFNMKLAYALCIGVILFCLSLTPSYHESFTPRYMRTKRNELLRRARRLYTPYYNNINNFLSRIKRRIL